MGRYDSTSKTAYLTLQVKRKSSEEWAADTTALKSGEPGLNTSTGEVRFGNGVDPWTSLTSRCSVADQLLNARTINGFSFNGTNNINSYVVCSTAVGTTAKTVTLSNFSLVSGASLRVKFSNGNTAASPTLNVSSTGAKSIRYNNAAASAILNNKNTIYELTYDGTYYQLTGCYYSIVPDATASDAAEVTNALVSTNGQLEVPINLSISDVDGSTGTLSDRYLQLNRGDKYLSRVKISDLFINTFLSNVTYNTETHVLLFEWNTDSGKQSIPVDLSDLVDEIPVYTAGRGLAVNTEHEFSVNLDHQTGLRDYAISVDTANNLKVDVPWIDTVVSAGNTGVSVNYTAADPSNNDYVNTTTVSHMTTTTASFTPGLYKNSTTKTTSQDTVTAQGLYISIPYITKNSFGHIGTLEDRKFKIVIDDGELV